MLSLPYFSQPFTLVTNASGIGVGVVLGQNQYPIAFFPKKITPHMHKQSSYARELYAITEAIAKF